MAHFQNAANGKYKTLFEQINAAALLTTFEGKILEANQKSCELFGYKWNELLHLSLRDLLTKETDWFQFREEIAARGGLNIETECVCKDGTFLPVRISISLFKMEDKPVMFVLVWDITEIKMSERKLRESEKKYRGLFEFTTDGIFVLDPRGNVLDVNTKICEMLDLSKDEIIGKNLLNEDLLTAKSLPVVVNQFEQLLSEKKASAYRTELKNKRGEILDVEVNSFFLVKKDNEVDNFVLIVRDITGRDKLERRRIIEHELLLTLMDNIPDPIYFKDSENRFILVNKAKATQSKKSPQEIIGKTDFDILPHDQAKKNFEDDNHVMQCGQPIIEKLEKTNINGSERWFSVSKIPRYNAEGDIVGIIGISRDVTLQEKARKDLARLEQRYKAVFENKLCAIILTDEKGNIISWNNLLHNLLGYNDLYLKPVQKLYPPKEWEKIKEDVHINTKLLRKDGSPIDVELTITPLRDEEGKILGFMHFIGDISEKKKMERKLKEERETLATLIDLIPHSIYLKDKDNKFILINKAKANQLGISPEDAIGKTDFDFLPPEEAKKSYEEDAWILQSGESIERTESIVADGSEKRVTKVPRYDTQGNINGVLAIIREIKSTL